MLMGTSPTNSPLESLRCRCRHDERDYQRHIRIGAYLNRLFNCEDRQLYQRAHVSCRLGGTFCDELCRPFIQKIIIPQAQRIMIARLINMKNKQKVTKYLCGIDEGDQIR